MESSNSLLHISDILTNDVLSKALTDWFKKDTKFSHWEYVGDTGKGDSYMSEVIKIKIHGIHQDNSTNYVQVIVKYIPHNKCRRATFRSEGFFENEVIYYKQVLPILLEFQASKNLKDPYDNYTRLFFAETNGDSDVIILEDVTTLNYGPAFRQKGIDIDHSKITLKIFAKFHAMSFALRDQKPEVFKKLVDVLQEGYYDAKFWPWYERFWKRLCEVSLDSVEKEYPGTKYVEITKRFTQPDTYKVCSKIVLDTKATGVVSHGDSWTNNFLYKYLDGQKPLDAKMIDFQLARSASPVLDLSFFLFVCLTQDLRDSSYDYLLKYYHDVLSEQIKGMGSDPNLVYSWETFMDEMVKYSKFGLAFSCEAIPFIILDPEDAFDMDLKGDEVKNIIEFWPLQLIKPGEGRKRMANAFVHAINKGYIQ